MTSTLKKAVSLALAAAALALQAPAAPFTVTRGHDLTVFIPENTLPVLQTALEMFTADVDAVFGSRVVPVSSGADISVTVDPGAVAHPQGFTLSVAPDGTLAIVGGGAHGAAYGLLEVSRLFGVSPWEWWADAAPMPRDSFTLPEGFADAQAPDVDFRGIFINDEDWGLMPWSSLHYEPLGIKGSVGPRTTARIFELLLRLRANTYWPPMHECTHPFFLTPGNREVAEKYGIYIGTSHCEPLASNANGEWGVRGTGEYDYTVNAPQVLSFWEDRVKETAGQEMVYTLGLRGIHDSGMLGASTPQQQKEVLQKVIADQRALLARHVNPDTARVPQVFIPYKEVLYAYNDGLRVPDDVTLMWCDDNYGYIRHFPTEAERLRRGGNGIYYHVSYWGRPHDYLWLGTFSPALLSQQMNEAYDRGIRRIWILNVGDIKPAEYQIELFLDLAWDNARVRREGLDAHLSGFLAREFGSAVAAKAAPLMTEAYRLAYIRKPEFMGNTREEERSDPQSRVIKDLPWSDAAIAARLDSYKALSDMAEQLFDSVPECRRDAFFQLVKYPVQGAAQLNRKLLCAQRARHGLMPWDDTDAAFDSIAALTRTYNRGFANGGKFDGIMDFQPRRLPPFGRVPRVDDASPMPAPEEPLLSFDAADAAPVAAPGGASPARVDGLGYNRRAVAVPRGAALEFTLPDTLSGEVVAEVCLLPTHPVNGDGDLAFALDLGACSSGSVNYATEGRSEEWKQNVLRNQAVRRIALTAPGNGPRTLRFSALSPGVVLDQIHVFRAAKP